MKTIWKKVLSGTVNQVVMLPKGSEIITAREQHDQVCIWYRCDLSEPEEARFITVCGTGHEAPLISRYIGTAMLYGGDLVIHVFEG